MGGGYRTRIDPGRVRPGTTAPGVAVGTPLTSHPPSGAPMGGGRGEEADDDTADDDGNDEEEGRVPTACGHVAGLAAPMSPKRTGQKKRQLQRDLRWSN